MKRRAVTPTAPRSASPDRLVSARDAEPEAAEGYYENADGTRDDTTFHDEILDNPEAEAAACRAAVARAVADGMDPARAARLYGEQTPKKK